MAAPKCFISYSWDNDEHKDWVRRLADELQRNGVETYLDQWDAHLGMDVTNYMETCIRESDFVLLVCTPIFAQKANDSLGGVGYEKSIVTGEIFADAASPKKFVPVLRKGDPKDCLPSYLKSRVYTDFRDDNMFDSGLKTLLRHLHQSPEYIRPPLGSMPDLRTQGVKQSIVTAQPTKKFHLSTFKQVYEFAHSFNGLNKISCEAEEFAKEWMEKHADKEFQVFKEVYGFAHSFNGLNKISREAEEFALEQISKG
jgi:hypothetical protein